MLTTSFSIVIDATEYDKQSGEMIEPKSSISQVIIQFISENLNKFVSRLIDF